MDEYEMNGYVAQLLTLMMLSPSVVSPLLLIVGKGGSPNSSSVSVVFGLISETSVLPPREHVQLTFLGMIIVRLASLTTQVHRFPENAVYREAGSFRFSLTPVCRS
jgi:hypothetical protein